MTGSSAASVILRVHEAIGQRVRPSRRRVVAVLLAVAPATIGLRGLASAHEIPASVLLRIFVRPDGDTLRVLVRAPLEAMRDIEFPPRDSGRYLDVARAEPLLRQAATTWIANAMRLYEGDTLLD